MIDTVKTFYGHSLFIFSQSPLYDPLRTKGVYERREAHFILGLLAPGDVFLDVGANVGYYTVLAASRVGESGMVVAYEPDPKTFVLLETNVLASGFKNVQLREAAIMPKEGVVSLFLDQRLGGVDGRCYEIAGRPSTHVHAETLEAYGGMEHLRFIKMDVQGMEVELLPSLACLAKENKNFDLMIEYEPVVFPPASPLAGVFVEELVGMGFKPGILETPNPIRFFKTTDEVDDYLVNTKRRHANLICLRDGI